ncbi:hypothetical protein [Ideonella sp. A 288]|uniref:hypothetical protein n=1 Tax=Ideonella sp. A 288 TaxID=1962181 RepID=UPI001F39B9F6|nr:hypothetical protein [Ideonella sp. A 288]
MPDSRPPSSLLARWTRARRATPRALEPADMGTAFGLECTLDQSFGSAPPVTPVQPSAGPGLFERWRASRGNT